MRHCTCDRPDCRLCWLYHNDPVYKAHWDGRPVPMPKPKPLLGDHVAAALAAVGVTEEKVAAWLKGCGCAERRRRLNQLDAWARRTMVSSAKAALSWLEGLMR